MAIESTLSPEQIWGDALEKIKSKVPYQSFNTWFKSTTASYMNDDTFRVSLPNKFVADWVMEKFDEVVSSAIESCLGTRMKIEYVTSDNGEQAPMILASSDIAVPQKRVAAAQSVPHDTHLNDRYIFDSFVVGDSNRFAHAAAVAVAKAPMQTKYNPLYVYGGVGLGKTHLVQAIGNYVSENFSTMKVLYVTSEKFTNDFIDAITHQKTGEFARLYRGVDLLLLDDIQFLTGKEATQEQFFHTFNALYQAGKQIVLTSDRSPREIKGLEERLLSRFQCGLVTDIQPPDLETRIAILNQMVEAEKLSVPFDVISYIANNITRNIRELEGSIIRLIAYGSLTSREINTALAYEVLKEAFTTGCVITLESITTAVCVHFKVQVDQLKSKRKTADLVRARQVAMYLCRKHTAASLKTIGDEFGGRDHSTVIHSISAVDGDLKNNLNLKTSIETVENRLKA